MKEKKKEIKSVTSELTGKYIYIHFSCGLLNYWVLYSSCSQNVVCNTSRYVLDIDFNKNKMNE